jgi:hypothetical protein
VFENRVLRRIFGPMRDEVTGEWVKLHNKEPHNLYSSPNIIRLIKSRRMRLAGHVADLKEERKVYRVLVGKPKGKRPFERPRCRWEDGIRTDSGKFGWVGGDSVGPGQGVVVGSCEHGDEPLGSEARDIVLWVCQPDFSSRVNGLVVCYCDPCPA